MNRSANSGFIFEKEGPILGVLRYGNKDREDQDALSLFQVVFSLSGLGEPE